MDYLNKQFYLIDGVGTVNVINKFMNNSLFTFDTKNEEGSLVYYDNNLDRLVSIHQNAAILFLEYSTKALINKITFIYPISNY